MTTTQGLISKIANFFKSEEYYTKEEKAELILTADDARLIVNLINENQKLKRNQNISHVIGQEEANNLLAKKILGY